MYIATRNVNTEFDNYKKGDIVADIIGSKYSAFEKFEEPEVKSEVKPEVKPEVKKKTRKTKKEVKKDELLVEISEPVEVEVTED